MQRTIQNAIKDKAILDLNKGGLFRERHFMISSLKFCYGWTRFDIDILQPPVTFLTSTRLTTLNTSTPINFRLALNCLL